jgi:hypothetical protein
MHLVSVISTAFCFRFIAEASSYLAAISQASLFSQAWSRFDQIHAVVCSMHIRTQAYCLWLHNPSSLIEHQHALAGCSNAVMHDLSQTGDCARRCSSGAFEDGLFAATSSQSFMPFAAEMVSRRSPDRRHMSAHRL